MAAGDMLRQAIALEPDYASGHTWYAFWLYFLVIHNWSDDPEASAGAVIPFLQARVGAGAPA